MKNNSYIKKFLTMFIFVLFASFSFVNTAEAKMNDSYFWGITANFEGGGFDGVIVVDDNGYYDESWHSFSHATVTQKNNINIDQLRCAHGTNEHFLGDSDSAIINTWCAYRMDAVQNHKDNDAITSAWGVANSIPDALKSVVNKGFSVDLDKIQMAYLDYAEDGNSGAFKEATCRSWHGNFLGSAQSDWKSDLGGGTAAGGNPDGNSCTAREVNSNYTWPGASDAGDAGAEDEAMLNWVNATLTPEFNEALLFVMNNASTNNIKLNSNNGKMQFLDLAALIATYEKNACVDNKNLKITFNQSNFKAVVNFACVTEADKSKVDLSEPGSSVKDFVYISIGDDSILTRWRVPKGYGTGQRLDGFLQGRGGKTSSQAKGVSSHVTTEMIVYQGMFNYYMTGQTSMSSADFYADQGGLFERLIYSFANNLFNGLNNLLNLYPIEDLCFNTGIRGVRYWMGVVPSTWFNATQYFYLFTFSISMIMLLIALVKMAFEKGLSSIGNAARRVSLMENIKRTIFASIGVVLFSSIFSILCQLNFSLVVTLSGLVNGEILFNANALSNGTIAGVVISAIFFFVNLKMNFTYILRGITVLICYLLGPVCIMCSALGDKFALITSNWAKEFVGNLFVQSVHALIMVLFISVSRYGSQTSIEKIVLVYSFIPLTDFIRTNLFALGKGLDDVGSNLGNAVGGMAMLGAATAVGIGAKGAMKLGGAGASAIGSGIGKVAAKNDKLMALGDKMKSGADKIGGLAGGRVGKVGGKLGNAISSGVKNAAHNAPGLAGTMATAGAMALGGFAAGAGNSRGQGNQMLEFRAMGNAQQAVSRYSDGVMDSVQSGFNTTPPPPEPSAGPTGISYDSATGSTYIDNSQMAAAGTFADGQKSSLNSITTVGNNMGATMNEGSWAQGTKTANRLASIKAEFDSGKITQDQLSKRYGIEGASIQRHDNGSYSCKIMKTNNPKVSPAGADKVKVQGNYYNGSSQAILSSMEQDIARAAKQISTNVKK